MFNHTSFAYRKTIKTTYADGKVVEEVVESNGPEAKTKTDEMSKEMDKKFSKLDSFFKKMDEAFKELF